MSDIDRNPYRSATNSPRLNRSVAAFVDILGYREYIDVAFKRGSGQEELTRLRNALSEASKDLNEREPFIGEKRSFEVRSFTDNLVIGCPILGEYSPLAALPMVTSYVAYFQMEMARQGYFVRGAIAIGDLYIDEQVIFGPALLDAYETERRDAVYPRVVFCESTMKAYSQEAWRWQGRAVPDLLVDFDQRVFVDYLDATVMIAYPDDGPFTELLEEHRSAIRTKLKDFGGVPKLREKYEWVARYHDAFCRRYPNDLMDFEVMATLSAPEPWRVPSR